MIPRQVHYCKFGGQPMNALESRCLASWQSILPDYAIKEWNEANSPLDVPYCRAAMEARQWSRLSNYVRLHALREEGGIYLDTDIEILRSLDPLLKYPCFVPFQQKKMSPDWINNAALGAEAGHPFLTRCLAATDEAFRLRGVFLRQPLVSTAVLKEMGLRRYDFQECGGVTILPHESFYPYPWYARFSPECITPSTYGIHHWEASWHADPLSRLIHRVRCWRHSLGARLSRGR